MAAKLTPTKTNEANSVSSALVDEGSVDQSEEHNEYHDYDHVDDQGLSAQIGAFVGDVTSMAKAELHYYRTRLAYSQSMAKRIGIYAMVSAATFFAGIAALIFGLLLICAHYLGPIFATIIVTGAFLAVAVFAGLMARKSAKNLSFHENDRNG